MMQIYYDKAMTANGSVSGGPLALLSSIKFYKQRTTCYFVCEAFIKPFIF